MRHVPMLFAASLLALTTAATVSAQVDITLGNVNNTAQLTDFITQDLSVNTPNDWVSAAAVGDPGIYDAYLANLRAFRKAGGSLFMAFNYVGRHDDINGSWGHLDHQDQPLVDAHKLRAVLDFPNHE